MATFYSTHLRLGAGGVLLRNNWLVSYTLDSHLDATAGSFNSACVQPCLQRSIAEPSGQSLHGWRLWLLTIMKAGQCGSQREHTALTGLCRAISACRCMHEHLHANKANPTNSRTTETSPTALSSRQPCHMHGHLPAHFALACVMTYMPACVLTYFMKLSAGP